VPGHTACWLWQTRGVVAPSQVEPIDVQSVHCAPPWPHAVSRKPATHCWAESQHPEQFWELHPGGGGGDDTQVYDGARKAHCAFGKSVQFRHCSPFEPQNELAKPGMHWLPLQHPKHVPGPHAVVPTSGRKASGVDVSRRAPSRVPESGVLESAVPVLASSRLDVNGPRSSSRVDRPQPAAKTAARPTSEIAAQRERPERLDRPERRRLAPDHPTQREEKR
jgi:hypothetical protein